MEATRLWRMVMVFVVVLAMVDHAQAEYACSDSIKKVWPFHAEDPCTNSRAYSQLSSCSDYIDGNVSMPSATCCANAQSVWSKLPACFCKVTFFSVFPDPGPTRALARPPLCNITEDLCASCPGLVSAIRSESSSYGHEARKLNTASVVTVSVIVTLAVVGCVVLAYCIRKRALAKKKQSAQTKDFVAHVNGM